MCVCVYIYIYIYIYIHTHIIFVYLCVYICVYTYIYTHIRFVSGYSPRVTKSRTRLSDFTFTMVYQLLNTLNLFQQCVPIHIHGKIHLTHWEDGQLTMCSKNKSKRGGHHAIQLFAYILFK